MGRLPGEHSVGIGEKKEQSQPSKRTTHAKALTKHLENLRPEDMLEDRK